MVDFDVIINGYGPTGKLLARLLADQGHKVAVVEKWLEDYPLPRAIGYFHDVKRIFHSIGLVEKIDKISRPSLGRYKWYNGDWDLLFAFDFSKESISGGTAGYTFNQPDLEAILNEDIVENTDVTFYRGYESITVNQNKDGASLTICRYDMENQKRIEDDELDISAKYIVGCDGANSIVKKAIDERHIDLGFNAEWLVVDIKPNDGVRLKNPKTGIFLDGAEQWCNPERPTTIATGGISNFRWEFMLKPGEVAEEMAKEENVWKMLSPWMKPDQGELIRTAVYNFKSLIAQTWRKDRLLIAGDAAHLMPPFMGQGMCSGMRDSLDLAWHLDFVLKGISSDDLLDNYQLSRSQHVEHYIRMSIEMGEVVCMLDEEEVRKRDAAMKAGQLPPPFSVPRVVDGVVAKNSDGSLAKDTGVLLPHVTLKKDGVSRRMDDVTGRNFTLILKQDTNYKISEKQQEFLNSINASILILGDDEHIEIEGRFEDFWRENDAVALIARPDFHAFGVAKSNGEIEPLIYQLKAALK